MLKLLKLNSGVEDEQPSAISAAHESLCAHHYPQDLKRNEAWGVTWIRTGLFHIIAITTHWATVPHFTSNDIWSICFQEVCSEGNTSLSPHLLPPFALSRKLTSCVDASMFAFRRASRSNTVIIAPAPMCNFFSQSNIIRASQWGWLQITTLLSSDDADTHIMMGLRAERRREDYYSLYCVLYLSISISILKITSKIFIILDSETRNFINNVF